MILFAISTSILLLLRLGETQNMHFISPKTSYPTVTFTLFLGVKPGHTLSLCACGCVWLARASVGVCLCGVGVVCGVCVGMRVCVCVCVCVFVCVCVVNGYIFIKHCLPIG